MNDSAALARSLATAFIPALSGAAAKPDAWYQSLKKPPLNPPAWVFGPVWTSLYTLMGIAHHRFAAEAIGDEKTRGDVLYTAQLLLNGTWSLVFFRGRSPFWAFVNIVLLLGAIVATINEFRKVSKTAAMLMIPYLLWVAFAAYLNFEICRRNRA